MTGQDLIDFIQACELQNRHFFLDVEGYVSPIQEILDTEQGDIILSQENRNNNDFRDNKHNLERYFSEWFYIVSKSEARQLWEAGDGHLLVLTNDGTDRYADNFKTWEEIENSFPDALFGLEKL